MVLSFLAATSQVSRSATNHIITISHQEDVSINKDYPQEIGEYQELQYTLQAVTNGNFHAASSDESEAF